MLFKSKRGFSLARSISLGPTKRPVYPGPLGWANQLAQIIVQEVTSSEHVFLMHDGTELFLDK